MMVVFMNASRLFLSSVLSPLLLHSYCFAEMIMPGTITNPPGVTFTGIISQVQITHENINGNDVKRVVSIETQGGNFNSFSGGFFSTPQDPLLGQPDAPFARFAADNGFSDSVFLTANPTAVLADGQDDATAVRVGVATYPDDFQPGIHELVQLAFAGRGRFFIQGSDQVPESMIFLDSTGAIVGTLSGEVTAVPEPNSTQLLGSLAIMFGIGCMYKRRNRAKKRQL